MKAPDLGREHGISAATFYGWKQKFGGLEVNAAAVCSRALFCVFGPRTGTEQPVPPPFLKDYGAITGRTASAPDISKIAGSKSADATPEIQTTELD